MTTEIECKLPIADRGTLLQRLRERGARESPVTMERNWTFDTSDQAVYAARSLLRLRALDDAERGILTLKRPAGGGRFKHLEEIETEVGSVRAAAAILDGLGYRLDWYYEKRRQHWHYGVCEICVDELPQVGCYLEIEAPEENAIAAVLRELNLDPSDHTDDSYRDIFNRYQEENGRHDREWRFEG